MSMGDHRHLYEFIFGSIGMPEPPGGFGHSGFGGSVALTFERLWAGAASDLPGIRALLFEQRDQLIKRNVFSRMIYNALYYKKIESEGICSVQDGKNNQERNTCTLPSKIRSHRAGKPL